MSETDTARDVLRKAQGVIAEGLARLSEEPKWGRRSRGFTVRLSTLIGDWHDAKLDRWEQKTGLSRAEVVRRMIERVGEP